MKYPKIFTIFDRDLNTHKVIPYKYSSYEFQYLAELEWEWYEKIDGMNIRIEYKDASITIDGRETNSDIPNKLNDYLHEIIDTPKFATFCYDNIHEKEMTIFGEGCDNHVRGSGKYGNPNFLVFDICINGYWLQYHNIVEICKKLDLNYVPLFGYGTLYEGTQQVFSGFNSRFGNQNFLAEGLIFKPKMTGLLTNDNMRIIGKLKYNDFSRV